MRQFALATTLALIAGVVAGCGMVAGDALSDAQQVVADMKLGAPGLTITATVDHPDRGYRVGEAVTVTVQTDKPASIAVLRVMQSGVTTLVFPNRTQPSAKIAADTPLNIPEPGTPVTLAVDKPGNVLFEVIGSLRGDAWLFSRKPEGSADFADLGATTRQLVKDIGTGLKVGRGADLASISVIVRVRD